MLDSGTVQSSKTSSAVPVPRIPITSSFAADPEPGGPLVDQERGHPGRAVRHAARPREEDDDVRLEALRDPDLRPVDPVGDPPVVFSALVWMLAASEPAPGSVSPYEPMISPFASLGRYLSFCSLVPNSEIGYATSPFWTPMISPAERLTLAISSATTTDETRSRPSPRTPSASPARAARTLPSSWRGRADTRPSCLCFGERGDLPVGEVPGPCAEVLVLRREGDRWETVHPKIRGKSALRPYLSFHRPPDRVLYPSFYSSSPLSLVPPDRRKESSGGRLGIERRENGCHESRCRRRSSAVRLGERRKAVQDERIARSPCMRIGTRQRREEGASARRRGDHDDVVSPDYERPQASGLAVRRRSPRRSRARGSCAGRSPGASRGSPCPP